jgi:hypothetical protein
VLPTLGTGGFPTPPVTEIAGVVTATGTFVTAKELFDNLL